MLAHLAGLTGGGPVRESLLEAATRSAPNALPGVHKRDGFTEVINVSPRESETERCTPRDFAERFQIALSGEEPVQAAARADEAAPSASTDLRDDEIWHWFVFGLLGLLVTESFVANRTAA
jgi:hypothetical protein